MNSGLCQISIASPWIPWCSRTRQTLQCVLKAFEGQQVEMCAEPRLREQDFGNFQDAEQMAKVYEDRAGQGSGPGIR